jgi:hypothetical protein
LACPILTHYSILEIIPPLDSCLGGHTSHCLEIYKQISDRSIYKYFKAYKKYISQQEDFSKKFEPYKWFNIYFCCYYNNTHFKMNPQQYFMKILFRLEFTPSVATKALLQINTFTAPF